MLPLLHFPSEILALIFDREASSHHVITLWKCGSLLLNQRLAQIITSLTLIDTEIRSPSRYPLLVSSFPNLRSLSIDRGQGALGSDKLIFDQLHKLPKELDSLSILSSDTHNCLFDLTSADPEGDSFDSYDWSLVFPELKTLSIEFYGRTKIRLDSAFPTLPTKLETFTHSDLCYGCEEGLPYFPKSLTSINRRRFGDHWLGPEHQPLGIVYFHSDYFDLLPPKLTRISFDSVQLDGDTTCDAFWISHLPTTLNWLKIYDNAYFDASALARLPKGLTSLLGQICINWKSFEGLSPPVWPHKLTELDTWMYPVPVETDQLRSLPPSLTSVQIFSKDEAPDFSNLDHIPNLQSLSIRGEDYDISSLSPKNWPSTLTHLSIEVSLDPKELITYLPATLKSLDLKCSFYIDEDEDLDFMNLQISPLPMGLTNLTVGYFYKEWVSVLPSTLTNLTIDSSDLANFDCPVNLWTGLPEGLVTLEVRYPYRSAPIRFSEDSFAHLRKLQKLIIPISSYVFPASSLKKLSRELHSLTLFVDKIDDATLQGLPCSLTDVVVRDSMLSSHKQLMEKHLQRMYEERRGIRKPLPE